MQIVITRTGDKISKPVLTQQQKDALWEVIVRSFAQTHPETLKE